MPRLPTYESPLAERGLQPSTMGISAAEQEGNAWKGAFDSLGQNAQKIGNAVEQHEAMKDAVDVSNQQTAIFTDLTQKWNQTAKNADPNDPEIASKWRDEVLAPALEKIGADVSSKHGEEEANQARNRLRQHFTEKTIADQNAIGGNAAVSNLLISADQLANLARSDPSSMRAAIGFLASNIDSQIKSHQMDPATASKARTEYFVKGANAIAYQSVLGLAEQDPAAAARGLNDGSYDKYLSPEQVNSARSFVERQSKLNVTLTEKANKDQASGEAAQIQATTISQDGSLTLPKGYYANVATWMARNVGKPGATESVRSQGEAMINYGRAIQSDMEKGTPSVTDPHVYDDFNKRAWLPDSDPRKLTPTQVMQARADHLLSNEDYTFWYKASSGKPDEEKSAQQRDLNKFFDSMKGYITKSSFLKVDSYGDQRNYEWRRNAQQMHDTMAVKGVPEDTIRAAIIKTIPDFQVSGKTAIGAIKQRSGTGLQPLPPVSSAGTQRKPGESVADFLKRTGG